ncbi:MAG: DUF6434 domain-containing protein [Cytobacillus gottheilii]|uniref:DUF6434 domain-containing protein n=1 Tax=Cytobacillus gottheilii TaxID=859144 RepID=UPI00082F0216|nr:DUF6434 domain-containing protein [Cytobacillus gottheilii]
MRPVLRKDIKIDTFKEYYWLKAELQTFCRENGISASGSKMEIAERIEIYLQTGEIRKPVRNSNIRKNVEAKGDLSLDTVITENHRCSQDVRAFFKSVIANFHFSTYIQNYFKSNIGKTYRDALAAWHEEEKRKKDPSYKKAIAPQFEYNQFIQDYFSDSRNKGRSRNEAIEAWNEIKRRPGSNKYEPNS